MTNELWLKKKVHQKTPSLHTLDRTNKKNKEKHRGGNSTFAIIQVAVVNQYQVTNPSSMIPCLKII